MPLVNPTGLYTAGVVDLNPLPYVQIALRARAMKQAKDEAVNQYFSKLADGINLAGVRTKDLEGEHGGLVKDTEEWKADWFKNAEAIKKGGLAQAEWMAKYQDIQNKIARSKTRGKLMLEVGKAKFEGKFNPRYDDLPIIANMSKSIYDPSSYKEDGVSEYGIEDLSGSVPRYDANRQRQFEALTNGTIKPVYDEAKARIDNNTGEVFIPKYYDEKSIGIAALSAANAIKSDKSARFHYEDLLEDENFVKDATIAFQQFFKTDEMVDTPEKAAMADKIIRLQGAAGEEKIKDVNYADKLKRALMDKAFAQRKELEKIKYKNSLNKIKLNNEKGGVYEIDNVPKILNDSIEEKVTPSGTFKVINISDLPAGYKADLFGKTGRPYDIGGVKYVKVLPNGNYEGENGYIITPKEIIINTSKRTTPYEKPIGTKKATIRTGIENPLDLDLD